MAISQCSPHDASWWKVKTAVPDKLVLFDEVIRGNLQRAFALCFSLQCWSVGGDHQERAGQEVLLMTAPSTLP